MDWLLGLVSREDLEGALRGYLVSRLKGVGLQELRSWVLEGRPLAREADLRLLRLAAQRLPEALQLLERERLLDIIRGDLPLAVGLFENWPQASSWLEGQLGELRERLSRPS